MQTFSSAVQQLVQRGQAWVGDNGKATQPLHRVPTMKSLLEVLLDFFQGQSVTTEHTSSQ